MNSPQIKSVAIIGCGRVGQRLARLYQKQGIQTSATVSSMESYQQIQSLCHQLLQINLDEPFKPNDLGTIEQLYYFVPPPPKGKKDLRIANFLKQMGGQIKRIVLISTTGVYGDCQGQWIDEKQLLNPRADRAHRRLDAEQHVQQWAKDTQGDYIILRVAGIYSKDQLPIARIKQGMAVVNNAESPWVNRIHADDLAMICQRAMEQTQLTAEIINVSDGHPSTMTEYFHRVADYANLERPREISLAEAETCLSKGMLSYLHESRRLKNTKLLEKLTIQLKYPCLKDGLKK